MAGQLRDTYVAALQHDLADLPADCTRVGVVRKPTSWFHGTVDENHPELGPPESLLEEFDDVVASFKERGMCDEGAHNAAWEELDFAERYRAHLDDREPSERVDALCDRLASGEDLALVCFENTEKKRCHRTILRDVIEARREGE